MNTRKYPRTLNEAFGPHTSHEIHDPDPLMDWQDKVILWGAAFTAVMCLLLVIAGVIV